MFGTTRLERDVDQANLQGMWVLNQHLQDKSYEKYNMKNKHGRISMELLVALRVPINIGT